MRKWFKGETRVYCIYTTMSRLAVFKNRYKREMKPALPDLPYDIIDIILTKMKQAEFKPVLDELTLYHKPRQRTYDAKIYYSDTQQNYLRFTEVYTDPTCGKKFYHHKMVKTYMNNRVVYGWRKDRLQDFDKAELKEILMTYFDAETRTRRLKELGLPPVSRMKRKDMITAYLKI